MKNLSIGLVIIGTVFCLFVSRVSAMTLGDVLQQYQIYKHEAAANPSVLGASTQTGIPSAPAIIPANGGQVLLKALTYSEGSPAIVSQKLMKGMQNSDEVRKLQIFLIAKGYLAADPTGNYYAQTAAAIKRFQSEKGINGDGTLVGPSTRAAIAADVAVLTATTTN